MSKKHIDHLLRRTAVCSIIVGESEAGEFERAVAPRGGDRKVLKRGETPLHKKYFPFLSGEGDEGDEAIDIILVRHGETEWNVAEIFRGRADVELNETGLKQAELLAVYLSHVKIEAVYSSPLKRAFGTAAAVAKYHQLEVKSAAGLIDLDFGAWQGLPRQEVANKYPELYHEWLSRPDGVRVPGGETLADVRRRATAVVDEVISKHRGTVVLATHRVVNKVIICALLGLDDSHFWNIEQSTCGITTFSYRNGQFILTEHNNTSFLKPLSAARLGDF